MKSRSYCYGLCVCTGRKSTLALPRGLSPTQTLHTLNCLLLQNAFALCALREIDFDFILRSEINAYTKQIKVISITSEMIGYQSLVTDISLYFHFGVFFFFFFDHL